jgi:phosphoglycolate phosphatase
MKKIKLIAFDFDGTLVDTKKDIANSVNLTLDHLKLDTLTDEKIYSFIGNGVRPLLTRALNGANVCSISDAIEIFINYYDDRLLDTSKFYPNCQDALEFYSNKTLSICSNKPIRFIKKILSELDSLDKFSTIVGGDDPETKKPSPRGLLNILSVHGVLPSEALMVGDNPVDIETGRNAKVTTCAVTYGLSDKKSLEDEQPDLMIDDIAELKHLFS